MTGEIPDGGQFEENIPIDNALSGPPNPAQLNDALSQQAEEESSLPEDMEIFVREMERRLKVGNPFTGLGEIAQLDQLLAEVAEEEKIARIMDLLDQPPGPDQPE